jgi:hypothetical protein
MAAKQPQVGQQYRHVGTAFQNSVWILSAIFAGPDGIEHALLTSAYDSTRQKTIALSVVTDPRQFIAIETRRAEAD